MRPSQRLPEVYLCRESIDFRKGINTLSSWVEGELSLDPFSGKLFVFINRHRDKVKILYWEANGFCLWQKRLEESRFYWPRHLSGKEVITVTECRMTETTGYGQRSQSGVVQAFGLMRRNTSRNPAVQRRKPIKVMDPPRAPVAEEVRGGVSPLTRELIIASPPLNSGPLPTVHRNTPKSSLRSASRAHKRITPKARVMLPTTELY